MPLGKKIQDFFRDKRVTFRAALLGLLGAILAFVAMIAAPIISGFMNRANTINEMELRLTENAVNLEPTFCENQEPSCFLFKNNGVTTAENIAVTISLEYYVPVWYKKTMDISDFKLNWDQLTNIQVSYEEIKIDSPDIEVFSDTVIRNNNSYKIIIPRLNGGQSIAFWLTKKEPPELRYDATTIKLWSHNSLELPYDEDGLYVFETYDLLSYALKRETLGTEFIVSIGCENCSHDPKKLTIIDSPFNSVYFATFENEIELEDTDLNEVIINLHYSYSSNGPSSPLRAEYLFIERDGLSWKGNPTKIVIGPPTQLIQLYDDYEEENFWIGSYFTECSCAIFSMGSCSTIRYQAGAQACYDHCRSRGFGDIHNFDWNNNGIACEFLP